MNVPNARQVAVIDREKSEVITTWKTDGALGNFPMAFDEANHRLLIGCRIPSRLVILNTDSGEVVAKVGISGDPDDVFYDSKRHRIYAICGAGKIDIIEQADTNNYKALAKIDTANGARTGFLLRNETTCLLLFHIAAARQRRFAVTKSNNLSKVVDATFSDAAGKVPRLLGSRRAGVATRPARGKT